MTILQTLGFWDEGKDWQCIESDVKERINDNEIRKCLREL
jgi:hypothetical protein